MDVNLYDDWETSMMALSAVDPFWKAKVSHEILVNPANSLELQTLCTKCHAPLGHYTFNEARLLLSQSFLFRLTRNVEWVARVPTTGGGVNVEPCDAEAFDYLEYMPQNRPPAAKEELSSQRKM